MEALKPNSALTRAAALYEESKALKTRNRSNSCRMFEQIMGVVQIRSVNLEKLNLFVRRARELKYAETSIKKSVCDVKTIVKFVTGKRLVVPRPQPQPLVEMEDVSWLPIVSWAKRYCRIREIVRREPIYSANRFAKFMGNMRVSNITTETLVEFRNLCVADGLSPPTIESAVSDLQTLIKAATGEELKPGRRCKVARPNPKSVSPKSLETMWPHCDTWLQQWMVLSFWTGLRLADVLRLQLSLSETLPERLEWTASKTQHFFQWPIAPWLEGYLTRRTLPFRNSNDWAFRQTRGAIEDACRAANVPIWKPKHFRQFAITAWMQADPVAGQIIHGCGLNGVLKHYIAPMTILNSAAKKVEVPGFFKGKTQSDVCSDPSELFGRLDDSSRAVMLQTMMAMLGMVKP